LQGEVLENLLTLCNEETSDLLHTGLLLEKVSVVELGTVLGIVSHKVLSQKDAGVEP